MAKRSHHPAAGSGAGGSRGAGRGRAGAARRAGTGAGLRDNAPPGGLGRGAGGEGGREGREGGKGGAAQAALLMSRRRRGVAVALAGGSGAVRGGGSGAMPADFPHWSSGASNMALRPPPAVRPGGRSGAFGPLRSRSARSRSATFGSFRSRSAHL
ncbi:rRNA 2'-O-methyltransferase fibrillarin-like [Ammospiza caudacuta]|uniref:rRNA 2'-O-methyltransferase fibrillarin-like n=1 Tax=Ammospiza caudacuta TaxID=2857398 RepID=UPI0027387493|nr:rRNA 2'-O-methyltransferase fibrillarin-like [Ammospiza caudacuta]